jgi:peptidoglycan hydrolase-like protein with peptidoglycan-binding domain
VTGLKQIAAASAALGVLAACGSHATNPTAAVPTSTAPVIRTDITSRQQLSGILTYAGSYTIVNQAGPGVFTNLPSPGAIITRGQVVYRVDARPIPLFYGDAPPWRQLSAGVTGGSDIYELQANLVALGIAPSALRVDNNFDLVTAAAVRNWQKSLGQPQTGIVRPGDVIFMPSAIRITTVGSRVGMFAQPGQPVLEATSTLHAVVVQLNVAFESLVKVGDAVSVALPDGKTTAAGAVTAIGTVATTASGGGQNGQNGPAPEATVTMTINLTDPAAAGALDMAPVSVAIVNDVHKGVLAVPVTALLAQPDGRFAVDVVETAQRRTVIVTTGLYDDRGLVEVTSADLHEGMKVEVPTT